MFRGYPSLITRMVLTVFLLTGCSGYFDDESSQAAKSITAKMTFSTTIKNNSPSENVTQIMFSKNDVSIQISRVLVDGVELSFNNQALAYLIEDTDYNVGKTHSVTAEVEGNYYDDYDDTLTENTIEIKALPSFDIKVASALSGLASASITTNIDRINANQVIGIVIQNATDYQVEGTARVKASSGAQSDTFEIKDGWFVSSNLLNGQEVGFIPNTLTLDVVFSYDGIVDSGFKGGYVRRLVTITKELTINQ